MSVSVVEEIYCPRAMSLTPSEAFHAFHSTAKVMVKHVPIN